MNSIVLSILAAGCACLANFFFRKNADHKIGFRSPNGYLLFYYLIAFALSFTLSPSLWHTPINGIMLAIGACVGIMNSLLMLATSRSMQHGPAGLTFAFQNASAVFPGLILFLSFGAEFGFTFSIIQMAGIALVLAGLFLGANIGSVKELRSASKWLPYALASFAIQVCALTCIQGRCILFHDTLGFTEADDLWFMPGQFGTSLILQAALFFRGNERSQASEVLYGTLGGMLNFGSTCLLLLATKMALPMEKGILFPCFAVATMILCNIWANRLYKEKFNLNTNAVCSCGVFMALVNA